MGNCDEEPVWVALLNKLTELAGVRERPLTAFVSVPVGVPVKLGLSAPLLVGEGVFDKDTLSVGDIEGLGVIDRVLDEEAPDDKLLVSEGVPLLEGVPLPVTDGDSVGVGLVLLNNMGVFVAVALITEELVLLPLVMGVAVLVALRNPVQSLAGRIMSLPNCIEPATPLVADTLPPTPANPPVA
jgi:hypothetical protein